MHKSVRGIIEKDNGIILIHRIKPQENGILRDYYVIPGGKIELGETEEETVVRELKEELGINVRPEKKLIEIESKYDDSIQIFYLCKYIDGIIGTGNGPEFQNKEKYKGTYEILVVKKENIKTINLVPEEIKHFLEKEIELYEEKTL